MKKVISIFDGLKFSNSTLQYSIQLAKQMNAHLVGIFLDDLTYHSYKVYDAVIQDAATIKDLNILDEKDQSKRRQAKEKFENACQHAKLEYSIHVDKKIAYQALIHETIYADICIIDFNETFNRYKESLPTGFIRDLLSHTQCPVLLVPKKYTPIEKYLLLYDGEPSSVYAIKQFSYLFHTLKHLPCEVLTIKESGNLHLPDNKLMKEFMKRHFPKATYKVKKSDFAEDEIVDHLKDMKENTLVVLGAYRRSVVSRWFRESMADKIMKHLKLPLFIAHN